MWIIAAVVIAVVGDFAGFWELSSYIPTGGEGQ